ncbi:MAG: DNA topoisomerase, partial [Dehalococcoidales bacterium]|nr:DNA topoisomerase [Dehalococcoidales bacterium]
MNLVIVESPTKARTIGRILGDEYLVKPSNGHIKDLPEARLGVDINNGFEPFYVIDRRSLDLVNELRELANKTEKLLLATDQDREGEAIAWDLLQVIGEDTVTYNRIHFSEIVREVIENAILSTQSINMNVVHAQRTRRILDRLIGYPLSDLLRRKVGRGISVGRVQSPAVKIIVDRERERREFVATEYWTIETELQILNSNKIKEALNAKLVGTKTDSKIVINSGQEAQDIEHQLKQAKYTVLDVLTSQLAKQPAPPFITSTLQREAASKLHFTVNRTMSVAQQLYEGIDLGDEDPTGLITYMRTDATRIADSAVSEIRDYIKERNGVD